MEREKTTKRKAVTTRARERKLRRERTAAALNRDSPVASLTEPKVLNRRKAGRTPRSSGSSTSRAAKNRRKAGGKRKKEATP